MRKHLDKPNVIAWWERGRVHMRDDFFDNDALLVLEQMPSGNNIVNIYLKLIMKYIDEDGVIDLHDVPVAEIAKTVRHSESTVEDALKILEKMMLIVWKEAV